MKSKFSNSKKVHIVLEGVKSGRIKELCSSYGINQVTYYKWRDKVLKSADKVFSSKESKEMERETEEKAGKSRKKHDNLIFDFTGLNQFSVVCGRTITSTIFVLNY